MTDEEIRMRCLELAYQHCGGLFQDKADEFYKYVIQNRYPTQNPNKITFQKISQERNEK